MYKKEHLDRDRMRGTEGGNEMRESEKDSSEREREQAMHIEI